MVAKFKDFDEYQLAKYNKEKKGQSKDKKDKVSGETHYQTPITLCRNFY